MKNKWHPVEWIYKDHDYFLGFAIKKTKDVDLSKDLVQDVFMQLLTMNQHKLLIIIDSGHIKSYVCKIILMKFFSKKSSFHKQHVSWKNNKIKADNSFLEHLANENADHSEESVWVEEMHQKIDNCLENFDDYDRQIFNLYYETGLSFRKLSDETGIEARSLEHSVKKVRENIKQMINVEGHQKTK